MAYESCGAAFRSSVAFPGSDMASDFIWVRTSRSCAGGKVLRVCEMASVHLRFGARSVPGGSGGRLEAAAACPFAPSKAAD